MTETLLESPHSPDVESLFLEHLPHVEQVAGFVGQRAGLKPEDVEDFTSWVKLRLIDDGYAVLRKHRGEARLTTYLTVVVRNLLKDFRIRMFGKYRPSAKAKHLGPDAQALERLLVRDRRDLETAIEILKTEKRTELSSDELRDLAAQLPAKPPRREVGEEALARQEADDDVEKHVKDRDREATVQRVETILSLALDTLPSEDLLILKMFFRDGCTIADISAALRLEQRPLYSRRDKCLKQLKAAFTAKGMAWTDVQQVLGWSGHEIRAHFGPTDENEESLSV